MTAAATMLTRAPVSAGVWPAWAPPRRLTIGIKRSGVRLFHLADKLARDGAEEAGCA